MCSTPCAAERTLRKIPAMTNTRTRKHIRAAAVCHTVCVHILKQPTPTTQLAKRRTKGVSILLMCSTSCAGVQLGTQISFPPPEPLRWLSESTRFDSIPSSTASLTTVFKVSIERVIAATAAPASLESVAGQRLETWHRHKKWKPWCHEAGVMYETMYAGYTCARSYTTHILDGEQARALCGPPVTEL